MTLVARAALFALFVVGVSAVVAIVRADASAAATPVCGSLPAGTTTWTSVGSPFEICVSGLTVPAGATLVIDGATGFVAVKALGVSGLAVTGGTLQTANTSTNTVMFSGPTAAPGSWAGLSIGPGSSANAALNNVTIDGAVNGVVIGNGATSTVGSTSFGLVLTNVTIQNTSGIGVSASNTPISVTGGAITNFGFRGIVSSGPDLTVSGVTISNATIPNGSSEGILTVGPWRQLSITNSTIDGAGTYGISLAGPSNVSPATFALTGNTIRNSGRANPALSRYAFPAIRLNGMTAGLGSGSNVEGNVGSSNGLDLIGFDGRLTNSASWVTPSNSPTDHPLGYALVNTLTVNPGNTLTLPLNAVVKTLLVGIHSSLTFQGATLDATAGGATITTGRDNSVGLAMCPSVFATDCTPAAGDWGGVNFAVDPPSGPRGNGALTGTTIKFSSTGVSIGSGATTTVGSTSFGLVLTNVTISDTSGGAIFSNLTPISVTGGAITNFGAQGITANGDNVTVSGVTISNDITPNGSREGIFTQGANRAVVITNNVVDGAGTFGINLAGSSNVSPASLTLTGNTIRNSGLANPALSRNALPAIWLTGMTAGLGSGIGSNVDGNHGSGNGLDLIAFDGRLTNSASWITPTNSPTDHPLGYTIVSGLTVTAGNTLTLPANAVVKIILGSLSFPGATLDATAGGATITTARDNTVGLAMCPSPSIFLPTCTPAAGDSGTLTFTQDLSGTLRGNGALSGTTIKFPANGVFINSGATATVGSSSFGLVLTNVTIVNASGDGVSASGTPISVSGGAITNFGSQGIVASGHDLTVNGVTISNGSTPNGSFDGIFTGGISNRDVSITNNTIDGAGTYGINLSGPSNLAPATFTLTGNSIRNSGLANAALSRNAHPAIRLAGMTAGLGSGSGSNVDGNHGNSNGLDLIVFDGTLTNSASWITPTNSRTDHALGYTLGNGLVVAPGNTLALPANAVVKTILGTLTLHGATLDATAGGATITTARDNTVGLAMCPSIFLTTCAPAAGDWGSVNFTQDLSSGARGNGALSSTTIKFAVTALGISSGATSSPGNAGFGLAVSGSTIQNTSSRAITATNTRISLTNTTVDTAGFDGISVSNSSNNVFSGLVVQNIAATGLHLTSAGSTLSRSRFTNVGGTTVNNFAVIASGAAIAIDCSSIHGNAEGVFINATGSSIRSSDLFGNTGTNRFDLDDPVVVGARSNWWGQAGGPIAGQIRLPANADTSGFLSTQGPMVSVGLADTNTNPNGDFGTGTMTVTLIFNREMDTSIQPTVVINPGPHAVTGAWQSDKQTWIGTYALDSTSVSAGPNTVTATAARSCVNEAATNQIAPTSANFTADFSLSSVTTDPATGITTTGATLNSTVNPNGSATSGFFRYGSTSGVYTQSTPSQSAGNGTGPVSLSAPITGLTPSTTYFFVAVATTGNGESVGLERSFTTASAIGPTSKLALAVPASATAGVAVSVTVTAEDAANNTVSGYLGTVHFTSSDAQAVLPADYTFIAADAGVHSFSITLKTAGAQSIAATDTVSSSITGTANLTVSPASLDHLVLAPASASISAGGSQAYTADGRDSFNNSLGDVTGATTFNITPDGNCTANSCSATVVGPHTVTGTHAPSAKTGAASLNVTPTGTSHFTLAAPASATAGTGFSVTVTARDAGNNLATGYLGTVHFSSSDVEAALPADYTFTAADAGTHSFSVTLKTSGAQSITATDTVTSSIAGSASVSVSAGAIDRLVLAPASATISVGGSESYTARGLDAFNNDLGDLTAATTFSIAPDGSCTGSSCTATIAGAHTVTGTHSPSGKTGTATLQVNTGAIDHLTLAPPSATISAGGSQTYTARGQDAFNNDLGDVTTATTFSITPEGSCTANTCGASVVGPHTVTGTHSPSGKTGTATLTVNVDAIHHLVLAPATATIPAGGSQQYTARAKDAFNNDLGDVTAATTFTIVPNGSCTSATCTATIAGAHTVTGTHSPSGKTGTAALQLNAGALDHLVLAPPTATITAGGSQAYTADGRDTFNNSLGDVTASTTFTIAPDGSCTSATCTATIAGAHSVTGTKDNKTGTATLTVTAASGRSFLVRTPAHAKPGRPFSIVIIAKDAAGTTIRNYAGKVHFTSTDGSAALPADYQFVLGDHGKHQFKVTLTAPGTQTITVNDVAATTMAGSDMVVVKSPPHSRHVGTQASHRTAPDRAFTLTVTAKDAADHADKSFTGTVHLSSSDLLDVLPADNAFGDRDRGVLRFTVTLHGLGTHTITVVDTSDASMVDTISVIVAAPSDEGDDEDDVGQEDQTREE